MKNTTYDIGKAFEAIENELMGSMIRNMERHKVEEIDEKKQWSMWQVEQLKSLEQYRKNNQERFGKEFKDINDKIEILIRMAKDEGEMDQEIEILKAIKKGFKARKISKGASGEFFKLNERKLDALIKATINDMQKAETAILRMADDQYRKIIYNAQVYANTGAGTYEKAVDMATKDMLAAGLNCVEYANGARHTLKDYANMAIRTASKRAYLQGEGVKRQEWGIATVIVNKRGNPCPKCLPFCGKVLMDDVWSEGNKNGVSPVTGLKYPLISQAVAAGLYHPNCRDAHTTYFEGISTPPDDKYTKQELNEIAENYRNQQKQLYAKRQAEKYDRMGTNSLDKDNKRMYQSRAEQWKEEADRLQPAESTFVPAKSMEEAQEYAKKYCQSNFMDKTFKGMVDFKGISLENANEINKALSQVYDNYDIPKISGIKSISPTSAKGKKVFTDADAVMAYSPVEHGIYINKDVLKNADSLKAYNKKSSDAWNMVMGNIDNLKGSQKELALRYKEAGRSLVGDGSAKDYFIHELGHHIQWEGFDAKTNNLIGSNMGKYSGKISGYATANKSEYFAESFSAYIRGERNILDPEFTLFLDKKSYAPQNVERFLNEQASLISRKKSAGPWRVDGKYINTKAYHDKFDKLDVSSTVRESVYKETVRLLDMVDGIEDEHMIAINSRTGKTLTDNLRRKGNATRTSFTTEEYAKIEECSEKIILIHNHSHNVRPSGTDIVTVAKNDKISMSIVACYDGDVYIIKSAKKDVARIYEKIYNDLRKVYDVDTAKAFATNKLYLENEEHRWFEIERL